MCHSAYYPAVLVVLAALLYRRKKRTGAYTVNYTYSKQKHKVPLSYSVASSSCGSSSLFLSPTSSTTLSPSRVSRITTVSNNSSQSSNSLDLDFKSPSP